MNFYILENEELKAVLSNDEIGDQTPIITANVSEKLTSYDILTLEIPADNDDIKYLKENNTIVYEDIKGYREYIINEVEDVDNDSITRTISSELSSIELLDEIVQTELNGYSNSPATILTSALNGTRWTVGSVDSAIYNSTFKEETKYKSVLEVLDLISSQFNCEVQFSYVVDRGQVVKRQVNLYKQFGENNGKRFEMDKDVSSIKRTIDSGNVKTAIIPLGKIKDAKDDTLVDIKDLVWSKANGDPVDKPKGQNYIGHPDALAQWGRLNADGTKRHRFITVEMEVDSVAQLASMAWVKLGNYINPKITYESSVVDLYALNNQSEDFKHEHVNLGDTVVVIDNYFTVPIVVQSRIVEMERNLLDPTDKKVVFGDSLEQLSIGSVSDSVDNIKNKLDEVEKNTNAVTESANGKNTNNYGSDIPTKAITGDLWYRPHPTKPNESQMLIWDGTQWVLELDTSDLSIVKEEVEVAIEQIEIAKQSANEAVAKADQAIEDAGFAQVDASTAKENAVTAITSANTAKTNATTALETSQIAITNSGTALTNAQTALNAYNDLEIGGRNLILNSQYLSLYGNDSGWGNSVLMNDENIPYWHITGTNFISTYEPKIHSWMNANCIVGNSYTIGVDVRVPIVGNVEFDRDMGVTLIEQPNVWTRMFHTFDYVANYYPSGLNYYESNEMDYRDWKLTTGNQGSDWSPSPEDVQTQITDINGELSRKVSQISFDDLNGTVSSQSTLISQSQTAIALKADKTTVNTLTGTVNSQGTSISANATAIALKANTTTVNTLTGTVNTQGTSITANATAIALKAESSLVNTINGTVSTHTGQISANSTAIALRLTSAQVDTLVNAKKYVTETVLNATSSSLNASITQVSTDLDNISTWERNYYVNTATPNRLVRNSGKILDDSCSYEVQAVVNPTGTINTAIAVFQSKGYGQGWELVKIKELGTNSNHPEFFIDAEGKPSIRLYGHTSMYTVQTTHNEYKGRYTPLIDSDLKFTTLNATVDGIQTTVGTKASQTQVTQLATQITTKVESSTYTSKMTQLDTAINLRLESSKVISQINISTEGILLQGKRIQLDGDVTMTTAFINDIKAINISADRITAGTLNASNVNIINLNASKIATGTISGSNSAWNLNTGIQTFTNPTTGDMLKLNQGEIEFQNGIQTRYLKYNAEGLQLLPGSGNTGTSKNTSLHLIGGGVGSYQYIQFTSGDGIAQRVETVGHEMVLHHGTDGALHVRRYGQDDTTGKVIAAKYETRHATGKTLIIARDTIDTERSGSANIYIRPSGAGVLVSGNDAGERYNVVASDFVKQSTRTSKTDIKPIETKGLDVINRLLPVSYKKKDKIARGIIETELGFISEDNPEIATLDGLGVYDSHINAYLVKAVQELNEEIIKLKQTNL